MSVISLLLLVISVSSLFKCAVNMKNGQLNTTAYPTGHVVLQRLLEVS